MFFSKGAPSNKRPSEDEAVPSQTEWQTIEEASSSRSRLDSEKSGSDVVYPFSIPGQRIRTTEQEALVGSPPIAPTLAPPAITESDKGQPAAGAPARGGLGSRLYWCTIAALGGVALTLNWQTFGNEAINSVRGLTPSLDWLASVSPAKSSSYESTSSADVAAVTLPELRDQVEPLARNLAVMRQTLEILAAKQEQMVQTIESLRATDREVLDKLAAVATPQTEAALTTPTAAAPPDPAAALAVPQAASAAVPQAVVPVPRAAVRPAPRAASAPAPRVASTPAPRPPSIPPRRSLLPPRSHNIQ